LATVLFTDIVGSTEKAAELGDRRWRDLLDNHHATIRRNLARYRGREIKTTGDGILATFDGPARGVLRHFRRDPIAGAGSACRAPYRRSRKRQH
jgi:class 3 adenylate cyclase